MRANMYLVKPDIHSNNFPYSNPQMVSQSASTTASGNELAVSSSQIIDQAKSQIEAIYSSFVASSYLEEMEPDRRLASKLYKHQKQALMFMMRREEIVDFSDPNSVKISLWRQERNGQFQNTITETVDSNPGQIRGGIIAGMLLLLR